MTYPLKTLKNSRQCRVPETRLENLSRHWVNPAVDRALDKVRSDVTEKAELCPYSAFAAGSMSPIFIKTAQRPDRPEYCSGVG